MNCITAGVRVIYFSGTGGTKMFADAISKEFRERGIDVFIKNLGDSQLEKKNGLTEEEIEPTDLNILLYPVYAMDAPRPVYDWIDTVTGQQTGNRIAVLSVSGGGEMWPNIGCRYNCCKMLIEKGFEVVYDRMLVMPANVLIQYNDQLTMHLIQAIPKEAARIADELLEGKLRRTRSKKGFIMKKVSKLEQENSYRFAKKFKITDACTNCGWCERNCPTKNIEIPESVSKPQFKDQCIICLRCIYGCPFHAIDFKGKLVLKNGFNLNAVEKRMHGVKLEPVEKCCRGLLYKGVKNYLLDRS